MARLDGSWVCRLEGHPDVSTDDLTLDEITMAEAACGVPYVLMDPHASARIAKALFAVMMARAKQDAGMLREQAENEAVKAAGKLTVRNLHGAFRYIPPTDPPATAGGAEPVPPSWAPTSATG